MGFLDFLRSLFGGGEDRGRHGVDELARRLKLSVEELRAVKLEYAAFMVPKRSGGSRRIDAPARPLKDLQRRVLHRLLRRLRCHPAAHGFERDRSIVTNALPHAGRAVVLRLDLKEFFGSTPVARVESYFRAIGWDRTAAAILVKLCTWKGSLPQGAPTSPRLSNLVNWRLDARLEALARKAGAAYTRYADDLTFSFAVDDRRSIHRLVGSVKKIAAQEGYRLHVHRKLRIQRRHDRQLVTGLVVNAFVNLPRDVRRRLRAIDHHVKVGRPATLTPAQLQGWYALEDMVENQVGRARG